MHGKSIESRCAGLLELGEIVHDKTWPTSATRTPSPQERYLYASDSARFLGVERYMAAHFMSRRIGGFHWLKAPAIIHALDKMQVTIPYRRWNECDRTGGLLYCT